LNDVGHGFNVAAMKNTALLIVLSLAAGAVQAQAAGTVTLTANATSAKGEMTPRLTWSTSPAATSCTASGGWSGTKAASGTQTLQNINSSTNYTLTCAWSTGSATVNWTPPTTNTDGTPLTNLAAFRVYYGTSSSSLTRVREVNDISSSSTSISALSPATWYFKVRAVNANQVESADSNVSSKVISGASAARTVSISITSPTLRRTRATAVYEVVRSATTGKFVTGRVVGTVPIGKQCRAYHLTGDFYGVLRGLVNVTLTIPSGTTLVAHCAT
jgi:hypothetical protein